MRGRNPAVALAPQHQRRRAHAGQQVGGEVGEIELRHHPADGLAAALRIEEIDIAPEGGLGHAGGVAVHIARGRPDDPLGQQARRGPAHQRVAEQIYIDRQLHREPGGVDQHQPVDQRRAAHGEVPGDQPAQRVADQRGARDLHGGQEGVDEVSVDVDVHRHHTAACVAQRAGQAERGDVEPQHAVALAQRRHQPFPGVQGRAETMDQHQWLALGHALLGVVNQRAHHLHPARCRQCVAPRQRGAGEAEEAHPPLAEPARKRARRRLQRGFPRQRGAGHARSPSLAAAGVPSGISALRLRRVSRTTSDWYAAGSRRAMASAA
ncbi:hypothetical protein D3C86_1335360 [compost metagenome]